MLFQRWIVVPGGVVALVAALLFVVLPSASGRPGSVSVHHCVKPGLKPGVRRYSVREPAFTSAQSLPPNLAKKARREVRRSAVLRKLLGGTSFGIAHEGAWTNRRATHLLGAVLFLRLVKPTNMSGSWPVSRAHFKGGRDYYAVATFRVAMTGVSHLAVDVDAQAVSVTDVTAEDGTQVNCP